MFTGIIKFTKPLSPPPIGSKGTERFPTKISGNSEIRISSGSQVGVYSGNFVFSNNAVTGGTLRYYENSTNGTPDYWVFGNLSAKMIYTYQKNSDWLGMVQYALGGNDLIVGSSGADTLNGYLGNDILRGNDGNDILLGGGGADTLYGNVGNDTLVGGAGQDTLYGGGGADIFGFLQRTDSAVGTARDIIADFLPGFDIIDLSNIDANTKLSGNQAFNFIGSGAFTGVAGQLHFVGGILSGDVNGDKKADFEIFLPGVSTLNSSDFRL